MKDEILPEGWRVAAQLGLMEDKKGGLQGESEGGRAGGGWWRQDGTEVRDAELVGWNEKQDGP